MTSVTVLPAPMKVEPPSAEVNVPAMNDTYEKVSSEARQHDTITATIAGAPVGEIPRSPGAAEAFMNRCAGAGARAVMTSSALSEIGSAYYTVAAYIAARDSEAIFDALKKYKGSDFDTLEFRQRVMFKLGYLIKRDGKYKRAEGVAKGVVNACNTAIARAAPVILYALTAWPDLKLEKHEQPFAIKHDANRRPMLFAPRALIKGHEGEEGRCLYDGQEGRTIAKARAEARIALGFGERQRNSAGPRDEDEDETTLAEAWKVISYHAFVGTSHGGIKPHETYPKWLQSFLLKVGQVIVACGSDEVLKSKPRWKVEK